MDGQKSRRDTSGYLRERTGCILSYEHAVVEIEESEKEPYRNRGARESGPSQAAKSTGRKRASFASIRFRIRFGVRIRGYENFLRCDAHALACSGYAVRIRRVWARAGTQFLIGSE